MLHSLLYSTVIPGTLARQGPRVPPSVANSHVWGVLNSTIEKRKAIEKKMLQSLPSIRKKAKPQSQPQEQTSKQSTSQPAPQPQTQEETGPRGLRLRRPSQWRKHTSITPLVALPQIKRRAQVKTTLPLEEYAIDQVVEKMWNHSARRFEWQTIWSNGEETWEPRESFIDQLEDGTVISNEKWLHFEESSKDSNMSSCTEATSLSVSAFGDTKLPATSSSSSTLMNAPIYAPTQELTISATTSTPFIDVDMFPGTPHNL